MIFQSILVLAKLFQIWVFYKGCRYCEIYKCHFCKRVNQGLINNVFILQCFLSPYLLHENPQISQYNAFSNHTHYSGHYRGFRITSDKLLKVTYDICIKIKTQRHRQVVLRKTVVRDWSRFFRSYPARNLSLNDLFALLLYYQSAYH